MRLARIVAAAGLGAVLAAPAAAEDKGAPVKAPPATECDTLVGNPLDPLHVGAGVPLVLVDIEIERLLVADGLLDGEADDVFGPETLAALEALADSQ